MKKILLIAPQQFFINRGTPLNVRAMAGALAELGYAVDLLVFPVGKPISIPGVTIYRSPRVPGIREVPIGPSWRKIVLDFFLFFSAFSLTVKNRYAILHGVEEGAIIAGVIGQFRRLPFVFDIDSSMPEHLESSGFIKSKWLIQIVRRIERYFLARSAAALTVCEALSEKTRATGVDVPIYQIEDFPVESATSFTSKQVAELRMEFGLSHRPVLLYTGNFQSYQGVQLLIESFALLLKDSSALSVDERPLLLLVGGGDESDPLFQANMSLVKKLGISADVVATGSRPLDEMGAFMALSDALVSPRTVGENTPLKIYSYMAANKPMVATNIKSHTQVLDKEVAFLSAVDPKAFAQALAQAIDRSPAGRERAKSLARNARNLIDTKYNQENFVSRLGLMYKDLIGEADKNLSKSVQVKARATAAG